MNLKLKNKITAIIPSFNHASYINECIDELMATSCIEKIIIIDDASTDNTIEKLSVFNENNKFQIILKERNKGLVDSLQLGLSLVETEFVYICASDDIPISAGLDRAYLEIKETAFNFILYGGLNFSDLGGVTPIYGDKHRDFFENLNDTKKHRKYLRNHPAPVLIQSSIFRTSVIKNIFHQNIEFDDYPLFYFLIKKSRECGAYRAIFDINVVKYRHHSTNTYKNYMKIYCMYRQFYDSISSDDKLPAALGAAHKFSLYFVKMLVEKKWAGCWGLLKIARFSDFLLFPYSVIVIIFEKIKYVSH